MSTRLSDRIRNANAALVARTISGIAADFFTADYRAHFTARDLTGGFIAVENALRAIHEAFPQLEVDVDILLENGDRVAWQRTLTGDHVRAFKGFPASGRRIVWRDMVVSRFEGPSIAEEWVNTDLGEQLLLSRKR